MELRRAAQRGSANFGWLSSKHTFSFGNYHDPKHMGFGVLRVINEDQVEPGKGFQTDLVHFLRIWILPEHDGEQPGYEQKQFSEESALDVVVLQRRETVELHRTV